MPYGYLNSQLLFEDNDVCLPYSQRLTGSKATISSAQ